MKILFIGDIVGRPGREAVDKLLPKLKAEYSLDFVIANAENSSGGSGITQKVAEELFNSGVNVLTSGDHIWKKKEIFELINQEERILRPLNYPSGAPGRGSSIFKTKSGEKLGVINVNGRVFMDALECPFKSVLAAQEELAKERKNIEAGLQGLDIQIADIQREAISKEDVMLALGKFSSLFDSLPPYRQKEIIRFVMKKVVLNQDCIKIALLGKPPKAELFDDTLSDAKIRCQTTIWLPL